ncbi:MAG: hypothetical protein ABW034_15825 [Steroidobacteraceae bacterium]
MHAHIDQLLSLRDGEPLDSVVSEHVSACPRCTAELQRLDRQRATLRSLPQYTAPDVWSHVMQPVPARGARHRWVAAAAVLVLAVLGAIGYQQRASDPVMTATVAAERMSDEQIKSLLMRSHELERALQNLPQRPALERAGTAATIDGLEQRIQWLDHHLNYAPDAGLDHEQTAQLWQERVALLDTLVKVRYAETGTYVF